MHARVISGAILGIDAYLVRVEADVSNGLPTFATVGLPQGAVKEAEKRVIAAVRNSGFELPPRRIVVNLAPADIRKEGSAFDLPIAIGILASTGQLEGDRLSGYLLLGELGLDGKLRPIRGALPIADTVRRSGLKGLVLPAENAPEAACVGGVEVRGARDLREVVGFLSGASEIPVTAHDAVPTMSEGIAHPLDLSDVAGQANAKRALEVAAAGGHNILMIGTPGSGKTMLARRLPGILPPLSSREALETTKIHSVAGMLSGRRQLIGTRPFRAPHHTVSDAGLIGGGSNPRPGEVSLAHNGILLLDELPEFRRHVLEVLRQPLEDHEVTISRAGLSLTYPARFMLVAAMNPCPCGYFGSQERACSCPGTLVQRYLARISGPLLDRIDIHIDVPAIGGAELTSREVAESSSVVRGRVLAARGRQRARFDGKPGVPANAYMQAEDLREFCRPDNRGVRLLKAAIARLGFSARAYHRVLKVSRTIADLDGAAGIGSEHVAEAIQYRSLDRLNRF